MAQSQLHMSVLRRLLGEKLNIKAPGVGGWWRSESAQHSVTQKPSQVIRSSGTQSTDTNFLQGFYFNLQFFIFDLQRQERGERWHKSHQDIICNIFNIQLFKHTNKYSVKGECSLTIFAVSLVQSTFAVNWLINKVNRKAGQGKLRVKDHLWYGLVAKLIKHLIRREMTWDDDDVSLPCQPWWQDRCLSVNSSLYLEEQIPLVGPS